MSALAAGALLAPGCARPYAAADLTPLGDPGEETAWRRVLAPAEQDRVLGAMEGPAAGHQPMDPPRPWPVVRFADVPVAVRAACGEVEMAVVRETREEWGYRYQLKTIEDWPADLVVRRADGARIYAAEAAVGLFGDHDERAAALLEALDRQLRAFARKRRLDD